MNKNTVQQFAIHLFVENQGFHLGIPIHVPEPSELTEQGESGTYWDKTVFTYYVPDLHFPVRESILALNGLKYRLL
jgi:hypothetical protein